MFLEKLGIRFTPSPQYEKCADTLARGGLHCAYGISFACSAEELLNTAQRLFGEAFLTEPILALNQQNPAALQQTLLFCRNICNCAKAELLSLWEMIPLEKRGGLLSITKTPTAPLGPQSTVSKIYPLRSRHHTMVTA
jgi:hypothetical protein